MRLRNLIAFATLATLLANSCQAAVLIENDLGGPLGKYILHFSNIGRLGERVIIDGPCYSACTTVVGLVPPTRICVTSRAILGFHAALVPDGWGTLVVDQDATRLMYGMYPRPIQAWLTFNG
jgi:hypothetical protein